MTVAGHGGSLSEKSYQKRTEGVVHFHDCFRECNLFHLCSTWISVGKQLVTVLLQFPASRCQPQITPRIGQKNIGMAQTVTGAHHEMHRYSVFLKLFHTVHMSS